jgi:PadR family transcriptional regulator AphA
MNNITDFEMGVLGFLKNNPMHGYAIHNQIMKLSSVGLVWNIKQGRLYQMLGNLEENGCVQSRDISQKNRPTRRPYEITEKGLDIFNQWKMRPIKRGRDFRIIFFLKLFFVMEGGNKESMQLLDLQLSECKKWILQREKSKNELEDTFPYLVDNFRTSQIKHYIKWLNWCQEFSRSK